MPILSRIFRSTAAAGLAVGGLALVEPERVGAAQDAAFFDDGRQPVQAHPRAEGGGTALANTGRFLQFGGRAEQIQGHGEYCRRMPARCAPPANGVQPVTLTDRMLGLLTYLNKEANSDIEPGSDKALYGREEYWTVPPARPGRRMSGDCEDYVLYKMDSFAARAGVDRSAMFVVTVKRPEDRDLHAILAVRTDKGDLLFNNLHDDVLYPVETGYVFKGATSLSNPREWLEVTTGVPAKPAGIAVAGEADIGGPSWLSGGAADIPWPSRNPADGDGAKKREDRLPYARPQDGAVANSPGGTPSAVAKPRPASRPRIDPRAGLSLPGGLPLPATALR